MLASLAVMLILSDASRAAAPEKPKLICRESEQTLGSHIRTGRRCKTAEEWQQDDARRDQLPTTLRIVPTQADGPPTPQRPP